MKYEAQLQALKNLLPQAQNILIALPSEVDIDNLASALALLLSLQQSGKQVAIVSGGVIKVEHAHLFGIGQIKNQLPETRGGNFVITLGGVVAPDGTVPSLQKLDWAPSGVEQKDLKLTFYVVPGQKFSPTHITPGYEGGSFNLIFVLGTSNLTLLGDLYNGNREVFSTTPLVNIDQKAGNTNFGTINFVDPEASSLSEIVGQVISIFQLPLDTDIASNLLAGIFAATSNMQSSQVTAEAYEIVAGALKAGGKKPGAVPSPQPSMMAFAQPQPQVTNYDLDKVFNPQPSPVSPQPQPSPEEIPAGEKIMTPEDDWLTPKIFKGGSIG